MSRSSELQFIYTNNAYQPTAKWSIITFLLAAYALSCAFLVFFLASRTITLPAPEQEVEERVVEEPMPELVAPDFSNMTVVAERKDAFFSFLGPLAEWENRQVLRDRERVLALQAELQKSGRLS